SEPDDPCESAFVSAWEHNDVSLLSEADDSWQQPLSDFRERSAKAKIGLRGRDILDKLMPLLLKQLTQCNA
ncbi:hypothetical protein ACKI2C_49855, partial [Streptomyces brasiliscabiei]